ncbi:hypothetical protein Pmar_PMAR007288, partial [Perkinsus marinus ATCC 50983]
CNSAFLAASFRPTRSAIGCYHRYWELCLPISIDIIHSNSKSANSCVYSHRYVNLPSA